MITITKAIELLDKATNEKLTALERETAKLKLEELLRLLLPE